MGYTRSAAVKGRIGIVLPPIASDIVGSTKAEPQFGEDVPLRPDVKLDTTVVVAIGATCCRPVISPYDMETDG